MTSFSASSRLPGVALVLTALATIVLFVAHPAEHATDFAGFVREQAASQVAASIVHGGFVLILAAQLACYAIFSARLSLTRERVIAALTLYAAGTLIHLPTILTDGIIIPALAQHYAAAPPDQLAVARPMFTLCGIAVGRLGALAEVLEGAGIATWGLALLPAAPVSAAAGMAIGAIMIAAIAGAFTVAPSLAMLPIAGLILWPLIAGALMLRRRL